MGFDHGLTAAGLLSHELRAGSSLFMCRSVSVLVVSLSSPHTGAAFEFFFPSQKKHVQTRLFFSHELRPGELASGLPPSFWCQFQRPWRHVPLRIRVAPRTPPPFFLVMFEQAFNTHPPPTSVAKSQGRGKIESGLVLRLKKRGPHFSIAQPILHSAIHFPSRSPLSIAQPFFHRATHVSSFFSIAQPILQSAIQFPSRNLFFHYATHVSSFFPIAQPILQSAIHFSSRGPFFIAQPIFH